MQSKYKLICNCVLLKIFLQKFPFSLVIKHLSNNTHTECKKSKFLKLVNKITKSQNIVVGYLFSCKKRCLVI